MKRLLLILIIVWPLSLAAQDRYIVINPKDSLALKQFKITWYKGIDPVKTKAGDWVLPERVIDMIPSNIQVVDPKDEKPVTTDLREYLTSRQKVILSKEDFPEPKIEATEPKIIK